MEAEYTSETFAPMNQIRGLHGDMTERTISIYVSIDNLKSQEHWFIRKVLCVESMILNM
jgi:hypothetical protein